MKIEAIDMSKIIGSMSITVTGGKRAAFRFRVAVPILRLGARIAGVQLDMQEPATGGPVRTGAHYVVGEQGPSEGFVTAAQALQITSAAMARFDERRQQRLA